VNPETDDSWPMIEEAVQRVFRDLADGPGTHTALGRQLTDLGWADIEADYPIQAAELLFRAQGHRLTSTDCLDRVMLAELATALTMPADAVLLPPPGSHLPASRHRRIAGIVVGPLRGRIAVPVTGPESVELTVIDAECLRGEPVDTFDSSVLWTSVDGDIQAASTDAADPWRRAMAAAQRALATELVAIADRLLAIAAEHAGVRRQFGQPIGAFQAVRHRLADARASVDGARALTTEAWQYGGALPAVLAKAAAGRAHRTAADAAMQTCGAIGLTAEHSLHRYVARGIQLDALCGSHLGLETAIASELFDGHAGAAQPLPAVIGCG